MTMNNPYFNVLNENIRDTIEANGDILITRDPAQSQERQNAQITDMLNEGIDFLFVNAVDKSGIESALLECEKRGVPVILIDTDVDNRIGVISAIQSDNYEAGVLLAQDLIRKKPEGAKILIVENLIALSMIQRRQGFIDTIKDNQKYEIVEEIDGVSEIETVNHAVIDYIENNDKDFDVIFGLNDPTAIGAVAALREMSEKKVLIYGVDGSPDAKELIRQGLFTATVAQHPIYMGKEAAKAAYDYLNGKEIESDISINVDLINAGNLTRFDISKWQ
nr:sugar ABC transporter substrate-binding protein [uncultured Lachnoanaerobaculum sp.]